MLKLKGKVFSKSIVMSRIMTRAWALKGLNPFSSLSECMRQAWSDFKATIQEAKETTTATVQSWFLNKSLSPQEVQAVSSELNTGSIEVETEKAVLLNFKTKYGNVKLWTPKKCLKGV